MLFFLKYFIVPLINKTTELNFELNNRVSLDCIASYYRHEQNDRSFPNRDLLAGPDVLLSLFTRVS